MRAAKRAIAVALASLCLTAIALWRIFAATPPEVPAGAINDAWELPRRDQLPGDKLLAALLSADPWGVGPAAYQRAVKGAVSHSASPASKRWSFKGMLQDGPKSFVLVSIGDKPAEPLGVGQTLPSGEKILAIDSERLCILINGKRRSLEIRTR